MPEEQLLMEDLDAKEDLSYQVYPVKFWKHYRGLLETRGSGCARCNGVTTPRKKLLGKEKKN
jgi:hypothetical protein